MNSIVFNVGKKMTEIGARIWERNDDNFNSENSKTDSVISYDRLNLRGRFGFNLCTLGLRMCGFTEKDLIDIK